MHNIVKPYTSERETLGKLLRQFKPNAGNAMGRIPGKLIALDLFAGSGGFSQGVSLAARDAGFEVSSTLINHWSVALDTARMNLGDVTVINSGIEEVDPLEAIPAGYVDILTCSPECIIERYINAHQLQSNRGCR